VCWGCGGIWFDWFELARVDEVSESAGEKFLEVERDPALRPDLSKRIHCPRDSEIMMRHFHSVERGVLVDECPRCAGFWLDAGELAGIRSEFATEEERKQAAQEYFSELFDPDLAVERAKTMEDLRKARRIAYAFRFICPSYYIPGEQDWGRFEVAFHHAQASPSLVSISYEGPGGGGASGDERGAWKMDSPMYAVRDASIRLAWWHLLGSMLALAAHPLLP
jgi:uncharacterized protein